ncbi:hypothetical protein SSX86_013032 [Deinandra increscens subsp. villosa]|uniref:Uncharacterized protein n=1 Tax=Deinandra increscens subsp. villosa TaxID=3103831 RepID=A0AAP0D6W7_9ASTR
MAKTRPGKRDLESYTIRGTNKVVRVGDSVLMRSSENDKPPYVARVESIEADVKGNVKVRVRWYYRPEESMGGRRQFHGIKELFLSDHYDTQSAHTIEDKCIVHTFKNYTKLEDVGPEDYFCRFEYKAATGGFTPDRVAVYCKCEMPYNPDDLMVQCEACKDWYHPACLNMNIEQAKQLDSFICHECSSLDGMKSQKRGSASALANGKNRNAKRVVRMAIQQAQRWILEASTFTTLVLIAVHVLALVFSIYKLATAKQSHEQTSKTQFSTQFSYDFEAGDTVLMRSSENKKPLNVARVESIETDVNGNGKVRVRWYCKCEMPKNPDDFMVCCEGCKDWYHPACLNMTVKQAKQLDSFICYECLSLDGNKRPNNRSSASTLANSKVNFKILRRFQSETTIKMAIQQDQQWILEASTFVTVVLIAVHVLALVFAIYKLATSKQPSGQTEQFKKVN